MGLVARERPVAASGDQYDVGDPCIERLGQGECFGSRMESVRKVVEFGELLEQRFIADALQRGFGVDSAIIGRFFGGFDLYIDSLQGRVFDCNDIRYGVFRPIVASPPPRCRRTCCRLFRNRPPLR